MHKEALEGNQNFRLRSEMIWRKEIEERCLVKVTRLRTFVTLDLVEVIFTFNKTDV